MMKHTKKYRKNKRNHVKTVRKYYTNLMVGGGDTDTSGKLITIEAMVTIRDQLQTLYDHIRRIDHRCGVDDVTAFMKEMSEENPPFYFYHVIQQGNVENIYTALMNRRRVVSSDDKLNFIKGMKEELAILQPLIAKFLPKLKTCYDTQVPVAVEDCDQIVAMVKGMVKYMNMWIDFYQLYDVVGGGPTQVPIVSLAPMVAPMVTQVQPNVEPAPKNDKIQKIQPETDQEFLVVFAKDATSGKRTYSAVARKVYDPSKSPSGYDLLVVGDPISSPPNYLFDNIDFNNIQSQIQPY
jgi:hypothetical protein